MMRLILASQSPRRVEILKFFKLPFEQIVSNFDEASIPFTGNPEKYVCEISLNKARAIPIDDPKTIILSADTIVYRHGKIYGKPKNHEEAVATLMELAGNWHSVYTGVTLRCGEKDYSLAEETRVLFNAVTPGQISIYCEKLNLMDKAGSYQLQMPGGLIVNKIDGCCYNVVGLPINTLRILLQKIGIDLWDYIS